MAAVLFFKSFFDCFSPTGRRAADNFSTSKKRKKKKKKVTAFVFCCFHEIQDVPTWGAKKKKKQETFPQGPNLIGFLLPLFR